VNNRKLSIGMNVGLERRSGMYLEGKDGLQGWPASVHVDTEEL
jgi:hypothetical protein